MYDPETIQLIVGLFFLAFFVAFILGLIYGLFLLAKIRSQAAGINKRLDELLARGASSTGSGASSKPSV